jgi:putative DNA primase/helicase
MRDWATFEPEDGPEANRTLTAESGEGDGGRARDDLPVIHVKPGMIHTMATEGESALIAAGAPLYARGGIVRPVVDVVPAAHGRKTHTARLAEVSADTLIDYLSRSARWLRFNIRKNAEVRTDPPRVVAQTILSREGEWRLPKLTAITTCPTLRPDGTIHAEAGFDAATGLLLVDPPPMPPMPDRPTRNDALGALEHLDQLLDDFLFAGPASRSVALSALITPVVRGVMATAPLHAISAPVAGSGKSYLVDVAAAIATGERAPVLAAGRTEEETEKRLGAALLKGQPIVSIDNVNGRLGGDMLCQLVERPIIDVRPLGASRLVRVESRASCFATGNNIQLYGDMTRRVIVCRLDPNLERPELRTFDNDPLQTVLADRGKYIAAALTVVRAYIVAEHPDALPELASFGEWSNCVRSALVWLGMPDPVETMDMARADDPETSALRALLAAWNLVIGDQGLTAKEVSEYSDQNLKQAMLAVAEKRGSGGGVDTTRLGRYLLKHNGRILDGLKISAAEETHLKVKLWKVSADV